MGYELNLLIGQEYPFDITYGGLFNRSLRRIAEIDLSNPGGNSQIYKLVMGAQKAEQARLEADPTAKRLEVRFPAAEDSNQVSTARVTDNVGYPLVAIDLNDVYLALRDDWEYSRRDYGEPGYRRFAVGVKLIEAISESFSNDTVSPEAVEINPLAGKLVAVAWGY